MDRLNRLLLMSVREGALVVVLWFYSVALVPSARRQSAAVLRHVLSGVCHSPELAQKTQQGRRADAQ